MYENITPKALPVFGPINLVPQFEIVPPSPVFDVEDAISMKLTTSINIMNPIVAQATMDSIEDSVSLKIASFFTKIPDPITEPTIIVNMA
ncbi:MAG: hypothetical protein DRP42_01550 [Tenericutes bacterium]|nr:MAG: hypothetical protein DRP42_01550 [Mycoplasmatota bacterium]